MCEIAAPRGLEQACNRPVSRPAWPPIRDGDAFGHAPGDVGRDRGEAAKSNAEWLDWIAGCPVVNLERKCVSTEQRRRKAFLYTDPDRA